MRCSAATRVRGIKAEYCGGKRKGRHCPAIVLGSLQYKSEVYSKLHYIPKHQTITPRDFRVHSVLVAKRQDLHTAGRH